MSSLMDWSLIVLRGLTTPHHLLPMKAFFPPDSWNKSTYNSCSRGSKSYSSIDNERSALASDETSGNPGMDQERSSVLLYLQEGWFAGFWNTKHLLRLDHSCAVAIPNSGLVSGAGLFIFMPSGCVQLCMLDVEHCFPTAFFNSSPQQHCRLFHISSCCADKYLKKTDPETGDGAWKWPTISFSSSARRLEWVCVTMAGDTLRVMQL